jgi:two-component system sensor histidine kinase DesK
LPTAADEVPSDLRELFAWTVREGVTNVIRHSGARLCEVRLTPTSAEVRDDGSGCPESAGSGSGLAGLRERAAASGATVVVRDLSPGYSLQVVRT